MTRMNLALTSILLFGIGSTQGLKCNRSCKGKLVKVRANDTCSSFAISQGTTVPRLAELNAELDCSDFKKAERYCVDKLGECPSGTQLGAAKPGFSYVPVGNPLVESNGAVFVPAGFPICVAGDSSVQDCLGVWSSTTQCDTTCGVESLQQQVFTVTQEASNGGAQCPTIRTRSIPCPTVDCTCTDSSQQLKCEFKKDSNSILLCSMNSQPTYGATFKLSGVDGLKVDTCSISFNSTNWNQPQEVFISPLFGLNVKDRSFKVDYTVDGAGEQFNKCGGSITGTRNGIAYPDESFCSIIGDPHIRLLNEKGLQLTAEQIELKMSRLVPAYGRGTFWLVNSPNTGLFIQGTYGRCIWRRNAMFQPTCLNGIYVQFGSESYSVRLTDQGVETASMELAFSNKTTGNTLIARRNSDLSYDVIAKDGINLANGNATRVSISFVKIIANVTLPNGTVVGYPQGYANAHINISPVHYQQTAGHCNAYDYSEDLRPMDKHILLCKGKRWEAQLFDNMANATAINEWTRCHEVEPVENGFTSTDLIAPLNGCSATPQSSSRLNKRFVAAREDDQDYSLRNFAKLSEEEALAECKKCFNLGDDAELLNFAHEDLLSCAEDMVVSGTNAFCTGHIYATSQRIVQAASTIETPSTPQEISLVKAAVLIATGSCSDNGEVLNGACKCNGGYGGLNCDTRISLNVAVDNSGQFKQLPSSAAKSTVGFAVALVSLVLFFY